MEYRIIELKDKLIAYAQTEPQEIKRMENKSERDVWDTMERSNFFSLRVPKEEVRENEAAEYLKK